MSLTSLGFVSTTGTILTKTFLLAVQLVVLHLNDLFLSLNLQCVDDPQWGGCCYLDVFLFGGKKGTNHCKVIMTNFQACISNLGVPIVSEKT